MQKKNGYIASIIIAVVAVMAAMASIIYVLYMKYETLRSIYDGYALDIEKDKDGGDDIFEDESVIENVDTVIVEAQDE